MKPPAFRQLLRAASVLVAALCSAGPARAAAERPPNILLILADDLGWNQVGFNGSRFYATPHLDRLAAEGMRFTDAYAAAPVCSPTRAALMTGQHPARLRLTNFIPGNPYPWARLRQPAWQAFLPLEKTTLPELLAAGGYATALVGKWHLAKAYLPPDSVEHGPDRQGFQETFITHKPDKTNDPENDAHNVEKITQRVLQFLAQPRDRPFFLEVAHNSIHMDIMERRALVEKYRAKPGSDRPENNAVIAAMMETLDASVGRILAELDARGLRENTIVIFYSDNGGLAQNAAQTPFRGGKAQLYEGGLRVPLLIRWPGVIAAGRTESTPVTTMDFLPTLLEAAGLKPPAGLVLDGVSRGPLLRGQPMPAPAALFWHYPHYHPAGNGPSGAVRAGDWKLIEFFERPVAGVGPAPALYNLRQDPAETTDLAASHPDKVKELLVSLQNWRTSVGAQMPEINSDYDAARASRLDETATH